MRTSIFLLLLNNPRKVLVWVRFDAVFARLDLTLNKLVVLVVRLVATGLNKVVTRRSIVVCR
jgi:hypothetical protein